MNHYSITREQDGTTYATVEPASLSAGDQVWTMVGGRLEGPWNVLAPVGQGNVRSADHIGLRNPRGSAFEEYADDYSLWQPVDTDGSAQPATCEPCRIASGIPADLTAGYASRNLPCSSCGMSEAQTGKPVYLITQA